MNGLHPEGYQSFKYIGEVSTPKPTDTLSESRQPKRGSGRYSKTSDKEKEEIIRLKFDEGIPPQGNCRNSEKVPRTYI